MKKKRKKYAVTLIEIMIVILLIGLIGGALAVNMSGSVGKGRAFKTEQNMSRIHDILLMESAIRDIPLQEVIRTRVDILKASTVVKNGDTLLLDGWGKPMLVVVTGNDDIKITSAAYDAWKAQHP